MTQNGNNRDRKASIIAAAITFGAALVILVLLFILTVGNDRRMLAESSMPEMQDDEEIFLEPEMMLVDHVGDEESEQDIEEAPSQPAGVPDPAPVEQPERVVKNQEPPKQEPVSSKPKLVSTEKPSEVKTTTPKVSQEDEKRIASVSGKFKTDNNGGNTQSEGTGKATVSGQLSGSGSTGRVMKSCPVQTVRASQKVIITVSIKVNDKGNVISAVATGGNAEQRKQCENMAMGSKWTPQEGAPTASGKITFTIIPK